MVSLVQKILRRLSGYDRKALARLDADERELIAAIRRHKLTYLSGSKLASIVNCCRDIEARNLDGLFVEAGCALGGSTILISRLKAAQRTLEVYDVFGMIPPPTDEDGVDVAERYRKIAAGQSRGIGGNRYYGYEDDLLEKVRQNLADFDVDEERDRVQLIRGLVQDTLRIDGPVAFAHIDVDWYDPVLTCLQRLVPKLVPGGCIILDDYYDWSGCRQATDDYFRDCRDEFVMDDSARSLKVTRRA